MTATHPFAGGPSNRSMPAAAVIPVLNYPDVLAASAWLCGAFGFSERLRIGSHRVQLDVGDAALVLAEGPSPSSDPEARSHSLMIRVRNADAHHANASSAGARMLSAPTDQPYGERQYSALDLAGHVWTFSQTLADVDPSTWGGERLGGA